MDWGSCSTQVVDSNGKPILDAAGHPETIPTLHCIFPLFTNIINWALSLAGLVALIFIIISAIKMITSRGDQKQLQSARSTLTWAIIGLIIILLSFFIVNVISVLTGATCIQTFGFSNCSASQLPMGQGF